MGTARHQQSNGGTEHIVKMAKQNLSAICEGNYRNWPKLVPQAELALNTSVSSVTGFAPLTLAFGFDPLLPHNHNQPTAIEENIDKARINAAKSQDNMERKTNLSRSLPETINVGDRVLIDREGIKWPADYNNDMKLAHRRLGAFVVKEIDPTRQNYRLELPHNLQIYDWFHISILTKYKPPNTHFPKRISSMIIQENYPETDYEVEQIVDHRLFRNTKQYLINWRNYGTEFNSWEPETNVNAPDLIELYIQSRGGVIEFSKKSPRDLTQSLALTASPQ